ncbi:MAG: hypothetical protein QM718_08460 [Steroidobacteraceae bacterium]
MPDPLYRGLLLAGPLLLLPACGSRAPAKATAAASPTHCIADGSGMLKARLRGAIDAELDWPDALITCTGGARPDGSGIRVSLSGPLDAQGRSLQLVFGLASAPGTAEAHNIATNVTVIDSVGQRLFSTLGDDKCQTETLTQQQEPANAHVWLVQARGFCIGPAATLDRSAQLWVERFDFRARIDTEEKDHL